MSRDVMILATELRKALDRCTARGAKVVSEDGIDMVATIAVGSARELGMTREAFDLIVTRAWDQWTSQMGSQRS